MLAVMTTYSLADVRAVCKPRDAWWTVLLVDPIACRLVRLLASRTSVRPNQVTAVAFLLGMCSAACFAMGEWKFFALGALFFHLGFIADCVDGKLARLTGTGTPFGQWMDFILDQVRLVVCSFALAYGLVQSTGRAEAAYLAGVIIAFDLLRYLNGPQMGKVRRSMRSRLAKALQESEGGIELQRLRVEPAGRAAGTVVKERVTEKVQGHRRRRTRRGRRREAHRGLHQDITSRFPLYQRVRRKLLAHRIRTHLVSGIEYQMAVFVVAPLLGPRAVPYLVGVFGVLMLMFEALLVIKLWMSTRNFTATMRRIEARRKERVGEPLVH